MRKIKNHPDENFSVPKFQKSDKETSVSKWNTVKRNLFYPDLAESRNPITLVEWKAFASGFFYRNKMKFEISSALLK